MPMCLTRTASLAVPSGRQPRIGERRFSGWLAQAVLGVFGRQRPRKQKALVSMASGLFQDGLLLGGLNALGNHLQAQVLGHGDHGFHNRAGAFRLGEPLNERAINLQHIHRNAVNIAERGVAGAEVVHGNVNAALPQQIHLAHDDVVVFHDHRLGQFQNQVLRGQLALGEDIAGDIAAYNVFRQAWFG